MLLRRRTRTLQAVRKSSTTRVIAAVLTGLLLSTPGSAAYAVATTRAPVGVPTVPRASGPDETAGKSGPPLETPSSAARLALVWRKIAPIKVERIHGTDGPIRYESNDDSWNAFDRDASSALVARGPQPIRVTVVFDGPQRLTDLLVLGGAEGTLSVEDGVSGRKLIEAFAAGSPRRSPAMWDRFSATEPFESGELIVEWRPFLAGARLREIALVGLGPRLATEKAPLDDVLHGKFPADAIAVSATPRRQSVSAAERAASPSPGTFRVRLGRDPRSLARAFLVYELAGVSHWTGAPRSVNGFPARGGEGRDRAGGGGLQVEEIAPSWLRAGENEILFEPKSQEDPIGYTVSNLRLVVVPAGAYPEAQAQEIRAHLAAPASAGALTDGDRETGLAPDRRGRLVDVAFSAASQPLALSFEVAKPVDGALEIRGVRKGRVGWLIGPRVSLSSLAPGWHHVPLEERTAVDGLRVSWQGTREGGGLISELHVNAESLAGPPTAPRLTVSYPLHGECVDGRAYLRGFVAPLANASGPARIEVDGRKVDARLGIDGAFSFTVPVTSGKAPASIRLGARYPDGPASSTTLTLGPCSPSAPERGWTRGVPVVEDVGAPFGQWVHAAKGAKLAFAGAMLEIPPGALAKDTRITVRPLLPAQVPPMDAGMENVTPGGGGFRLGPHGLRFQTPIKVSFGYQKSRTGERDGRRLGTSTTTRARGSGGPCNGSRWPSTRRCSRAPRTISPIS